jgi:C4-dicarboxylate-specific signal transduction histidine kinase
MEKLLKKDKKIAPTVGSRIQKAYELMTSNPEECVRLAREALEISKKHKFDFGMGHSYIHIGLGHYHQGELAKALEQYKLAESVFHGINNIHGLRSVYNNIGIVYDDWQDCDKALQYYKMNLDLQQEGDDPKIKCNILINMGIMHYSSHDYQAAKQCYLTSLDLARSIGSAYSECNALNNLGINLLSENDFEGALAYFRQSIQVAEPENLTSKMISALEQIAKVYLQRQDYQEAINYNHQAMEKAKMISDKYSISWIAMQFATIYQELGDLAKQRANLELCLSLAIPEQYRTIAVAALRDLAEVYESEGDYKQALETYWQYQEMKDYVSDQARNQYIQQLRMQMQVDEKEREMQLTRKTNLAMEKKNKLINRQKNKLEKAEKTLREWNHTLETRVNEEILKRQQQEQIVIQKSKLESLGSLAAGIAHEINQPLGMINIGIQNLFNKLSSGSVSKEYMAEKALYFSENIDRIRKIIDHVRIFSRDQQSDIPEPTDTREIITNALSMLQAQCIEHNIKIDIELPAVPMPVFGNKYRLEQVILNLISNAKDAVEEKYDSFDDTKRITIRNFLSDNKISIQVEDNGSGICSDHQNRIFEPFFTTKSESMGTGLGLSICYGIIQDMEGTISCRSEIGSGTVMTIELPACL